MEKYEEGGGEHNEQRNVVARANLWVYLITKFALRREGLTMEASMLTVSLVNYDTVCLLLRYLHPGTREISNAMKRQCLSCKQCHPSSRSSFDTRRGGTNGCCQFTLSRENMNWRQVASFLLRVENTTKVERWINFISSRELIIPRLSYIRRDSYFIVITVSRFIF